MKFKELDQAAKDNTPMACKTSKHGVTFPVRVVGTRVGRRVVSGARWDFNGHIAEDGVQVVFLDPKTLKPIPSEKQAGKVKGEIVSQKHITRTWAEHQDADKVERERKATVEAERRAREAKLLAAAEVLRAQGIQCNAIHTDYSVARQRYVERNVVVLDLDTVITLAERLNGDWSS